jgi:hypothetical protein
MSRKMGPGAAALVAMMALCIAAQQGLGDTNIMHVGSSFHGIRDYREVMPGVLYRGGANNGHAPLTPEQLDALCEQGMGTAVYLYSTGFGGPSTRHCTKGSLDYIYKGWDGAGRAAIHQQIYNTIKGHGKPVFIHCWNGIHATGAVAATALMQFCNLSADQAIAYWKIGIAPAVQYPKVIQSIREFRPDPKLMLTPEEQREYCPQV